MVCRQCQGIERFFDQREAQAKLKQYRNNGPRKTTRVLIDAIKAEGVEGRTLLDIGGGVGVIQHELLKAGATSSVGVDASKAHTQAAREEGDAQGHAGRMSFHHGDFVEIAKIAGNIQPADIVTLDRVICCYHDLDSLVGLSAQQAGSLYGIIYPRDNWLLRTLFSAFNTYLWLRRNPFRLFVHPASAVDGLLHRHGFQGRFHHKTLLWQVAVYGR